VKGERLEPPPFLEKESVLLLASNEPIRESVLGQAICDDPVSGHKP
jgi:hypothetical protein